MDLQRVKVSELRFYPGNPRRIDKETLERLKWSIQEFGVVEPLVINGKKQVIGGNQRLKALRELGIEEVDCIQVDLPVEKEKALNLALNKITGEWDIELLKTFILDIEDNILELVGFDTKEIDELTDIETEIEGEDEVPELEEETFTQTGDIWILGRHRLMCGDATKREDIEKLMNGEKADMVFTDPPFDLDDISWFKLIPSHDKTQIFVMSKDKTVVALASHYKDLFRHFFVVDFVIATLISKNRPMQRHDLIAYFANKNNFNNTGDGFSTIIESYKIRKGNFKHEKQVRLPAKFIVHYSKQSDIILDLFGGSGSTLIACEQLNRTCYMMEIDPHYCDVIVKRYMKFTGKKDVILIRGGKEIPYSEIKGQAWT